jgi:hypothetical protein
MKGFIRKAALVLGCAATATGIGCNTIQTCSSCGDGAGSATTCCTNKGLYDRCYPQRYNNLAQREVNLAMTGQVQNGHVLDQTVWNHHFECGTDHLTPGGMYQLQYISRRRPCPDTTVYLASALDLPYDANCPERYCAAKQELDSLRVAAVQKYLMGLNCGRPADYQVVVHDPADVSISAIPASFSVLQMYARFRGGLATGVGGGGGAAGPSGGGTAVGGAGGGAAAGAGTGVTGR